MNGRDHAATSAPVRTVTTSGIESAAAASRETISACACGERSTAAWAVPGRSPTSSAKRLRPVSSAASSTRSTARPTRRGKVLGESGGLGMRSAVQGTIGEMVAGNGSGDSPGNDGSSLVRVPARAAYSFADTDRAVIFPIRLDVGLAGGCEAGWRCTDRRPRRAHARCVNSNVALVNWHPVRGNHRGKGNYSSNSRPDIQPQSHLSSVPSESPLPMREESIYSHFAATFGGLREWSRRETPVLCSGKNTGPSRSPILAVPTATMVVGQREILRDSDVDG